MASAFLARDDTATVIVQSKKRCTKHRNLGDGLAVPEWTSAIIYDDSP